MKKTKSAERGGKVAVKTSMTPAKSAGRALTPFEEMDLLFDRLSSGLMSRLGFPSLAESGWPFRAEAPKVDVIDRGNELVLRAEIPGVAKDDLSVTLTDNSVTIGGETRKESKEEKGDYVRREMSRGSFQRTLGLPSAVSGDSAKATFTDGVLEIVLPKVEKKPAGKTVKIE